MLAYGAAVTSLGLALATWVKRFGMAIGLSVIVYVVITGGSILVLLAVGPAAMEERSLAFISPWYGAGELTFEIGGHGGGREPVGWKIAWGVVYAVAALLLLIATRKTFDRYMGRMSDTGVRKPRYHVRRR
jgi:ABC-type transport system involved in multi-copper enzyme maturation permease subunit